METCSTGYCNGAGACVQCNNPNQCPPSGPCFDPTCSAQHACGETPKNPRTPCTGGLCNASGACVQCLISTDCQMPQQECMQATCNGSQMCVTSPKGPGTMCSGGGNTWVCDGSGACVDCIGAAQCSMTEVCRTNACVNAVHTAGWDMATGSTTALNADELHLKMLPAMPYPARLISFGAIGTAAGQNAKMAIYSDNGAGTGPAGAPLATQIQPAGLALGPSPVEMNASNNAQLSGGGRYWLAIKVNQAATLRSQSSPNVTGRRYFAPPVYTDPFQDFGGGTPLTGVAFSSGQIAIYIKVQDTQ